MKDLFRPLLRNNQSFILGFISGFVVLSIFVCSLNLLSRLYVEDFSSYVATDDANKRKQLLVIIHSGISDRTEVDRKIRSTWEDEWGNDYIIVTGKSDSQVEEVPPHNVLELDIDDFPSTIHLTHKELEFILSQVKNNFLKRYWWFLLAPTNTYVSSDNLAELLATMNPTKKVYLGHPSEQTLADGTVYCEAGPGILLSYGALQEIDVNVGSCIISSSHEHSDMALGDCLKHHLHTQCSGRSMDLENMFFYDHTGHSRTPRVLWHNSTYTSLVTLYPIQDYHHLEAVHVWRLSRLISQHRMEASDAFQLLQSNSLCHSSITECKLPSTDSIFSELSYKELRMNCSLFERGYITDVRKWVEIWDIVTSNNLYSGKTTEPQQLIYGRVTDELRYATSVAMELVQQQAPNTELVSIVNCYIRHKGTVGQEFILDLELLGKKDKPGSSWYKRIALLFPFHSKLHLLNDTKYVQQLTTSVPVHIIIPFSGLIKRPKISILLKTLYKLCIKDKGNCKLTYILFNSNEQKSEVVRSYLDRYAKKFSNYISNVKVHHGNLNKTLGYNMGVASLSNNDLALLIDENIVLSGNFLERCRQYAVRGYQVYVPDVFKQYNLHYVYPKVKTLFRRYGMARQHGHWAKHGVFCIYKSDFMDLGQYESIGEWDLHPELIPTTATGGIKVIQSLDSGITHKYSDVKCDTSLPPDQFSLCLTLRKDDLGDRAILANYALSLEEKCHVNQKH